MCTIACQSTGGEVLVRRLRHVAQHADDIDRARARRAVGVEHTPRATDGELLALARVEERILITEDQDFGELIFVR